MNDTQELNAMLDREQHQGIAFRAILPKATKRSHLFPLSDAVGFDTALRVMRAMGGQRVFVPSIKDSRRTLYLVAALISIYRHGFSFEEAIETFRVRKSELRSAMTALQKYQHLAEFLRTDKFPFPPSSPRSTTDQEAAITGLF